MYVSEDGAAHSDREWCGPARNSTVKKRVQVTIGVRHGCRNPRVDEGAGLVAYRLNDSISGEEDKEVCFEERKNAGFASEQERLCNGEGTSDASFVCEI